MKNSPPNDAFKVYVEQLRSGNVEQLKEEFNPDFLDIHEKELIFADTVYLNGEAYLAENDLILHFNISTMAEMPCRICNETVKVPIKVQNVYHHEPLSAIKSGIFNMLDVLREAVLLEIPPLAECNEGKCPKRKDLEKYIRTPPASSTEEPGYRPFENL